MKHLLLLASVVAIAACGPKSSSTTDPCKDPCKDKKEGPAFNGPLEAGQWEGMKHEEREAFMKQIVLPAMKERFQEFDAEGFAEFDCATCHGAGAANDSFEMPNPDLPVLTGALFENPGDEQAIFDFMSKTVKPHMAELLGMPEMTDTQEGFSCASCHTFGE